MMQWLQTDIILSMHKKQAANRRALTLTCSSDDHKLLQSFSAQLKPNQAAAMHYGPVSSLNRRLQDEPGTFTWLTLAQKGRLTR